MLALTLSLLLAGAPPVADGYYNGRLSNFQVLQLKVSGKTGHFLRLVTMHLPPAELESLDVTLTVTASTVCLAPAPRGVEPCLQRKGDQLVAEVQGERAPVPLLREAGDAR